MKKQKNRTRKLLGLFVATNFVAPRVVDWAVTHIKEREQKGTRVERLIGQALETVGVPLFKTAWFYFNTIQLNAELQREIDEIHDIYHLSHPEDESY